LLEARFRVQKFRNMFSVVSFILKYFSWETDNNQAAYNHILSHSIHIEWIPILNQENLSNSKDSSKQERNFLPSGDLRQGDVMKWKVSSAMEIHWVSSVQWTFHKSDGI
jgi:hypothetical protein